MKNPRSVKRSKVFIKTGILKFNEWNKNYDKWQSLGFYAGDTIEKVGLLREFSLSQFTYKTIEQYTALEKEVQSNKRRYGQSYEGYFTNSDGTLDYQSMIKFINDAIANGAMSINKLLDENRNRHRNGQISHPEWEIYKQVAGMINAPLSSDNDDISDVDELDIDDSMLEDIDWNEITPLKIDA